MLDSFHTSTGEEYGFGNRADRFGSTFQTRNALVVADSFDRVHFDVHRAHDRAGAVCFAGGLSAFDGEDAEEIGNSEHGSVRAGILAPRAFYEN